MHRILQIENNDCWIKQFGWYIITYRPFNNKLYIKCISHMDFTLRTIKRRVFARAIVINQVFASVECNAEV